MSGENLYERLHALDRRLSIHEISQSKDMSSLNTALKLQAAEYERRLDILNGEAGRLREMQVSYVPREVYDQRHEELEREIRELKSYRDQSLGRQAIIATIIPVIISLLFLWLGKH